MNSTARSFVLGLLIITATICLILGLTLPIVKLTRLYIWTDVHSLISIVWDLYFANELFLASIIAIFSVFFPFFKLLYLLAVYSLRQVNPGHNSPWLKRLSWLGKWSMLDVLVLALVIFYAKSMKLADAVSMPGIYMFAAAVILTMLANAILEYETQASRVVDKGKLHDVEAGRTQFNGQSKTSEPALEAPRSKT